MAGDFHSLAGENMRDKGDLTIAPGKPVPAINEFFNVQCRARDRRSHPLR